MSKIAKLVKSQITNAPPSLVLTTLDEALAEEPDRKCFRLVGGVLVERTVKDVVPALNTNKDGVSVLSQRLFSVRTHIRVRSKK